MVAFPLLLWFLAGCGGVGSVPAVRVRLAGAQIPVELVESWLREAQVYRFDVSRSEFPTWSQRGFEALQRGECDVACTDRVITAAEAEKFGPQKLQGYRVAFYGYALYVHPQNPLDSIFARHIALLFQKRMRDWKELATEAVPGLEGPIALYGPRKLSRGGEILARQANIWFAAPTWTALDRDDAIIDAVANDPAALGFASVGYHGDVRALGIRMERSGEPGFPSLEAIESERYGLAKVIYVYALSPPSPSVNAVVEFLFSDAGRAAIEATQVWPIAWERAAVAPPR